MDQEYVPLVREKKRRGGKGVPAALHSPEPSLVLRPELEGPLGCHIDMSRVVSSAPWEIRASVASVAPLVASDAEGKSGE